MTAAGRLLKNVVYVQFIESPLYGIFINVFYDLIVIVLIADDVVVK